MASPSRTALPSPTPGRSRIAVDVWRAHLYVTVGPLPSKAQLRSAGSRRRWSLSWPRLGTCSQGSPRRRTTSITTERCYSTIWSTRARSRSRAAVPPSTSTHGLALRLRHHHRCSRWPLHSRLYTPVCSPASPTAVLEMLSPPSPPPSAAGEDSPSPSVAGEEKPPSPPPSVGLDSPPAEKELRTCGREFARRRHLPVANIAWRCCK